MNPVLWVKGLLLLLGIVLVERGVHRHLTRPAVFEEMLDDCAAEWPPNGRTA